MSKVKHGMTRRSGGIPKVYRAWVEMKRRCNNPSRKGYQYYGGRGISYQHSWESFDGFYADMGSSWREGLSLDRINGEGNYCKENCRWADRFTQARNRSNRRLFLFDGVYFRISELLMFSVVPYKTLKNRLYRGWPTDIALQTPIST